ncbi:hypothetical protein M2323_002383 [Rhodoblastus acidophilus]|uniref:hypothetical protein n=1 Tax=Rhodoblastus acidophilus TaxID=1074 RepID=UPI002224F59A|nr:hypothetical protein [Rhodoblastus acidophilus]MCW2286363.1 hypothetical protein [Rhodoblastus acidophilus]MCW2333449.1 hypothetical protein [Rhodoblastus acidophilus]
MIKMNFLQITTASFAFVFFASESQCAEVFNDYIVKSVMDSYKNNRGGGYDINSAFTHNIKYSNDGIIKATRPALTMCVAGVTEVIVNAINIYAQTHQDETVYKKIPLTAWTRGNVTSLRANIFMFDGTGSRGTGHTLAKFGLGEEKRFRDLEPGDFINLNRKKSGHAVVFLGFLKPDLTRSKAFSSDVVGFRYFSAQGKGKPDAGFAFRNAFFGEYCPADAPNNCTDEFCPASRIVPHDCGVIRSDNRALLNAGQMWAPNRWTYLDAVERIKLQTRSILEDENPEAERGTIDLLLDQQLNKELKWTDEQSRAFDPTETD